MTLGKLVGGLVFLAITGGLVTEYGRGLGPQIERERESACLGIGAIKRDEPAPDFELANHAGTKVRLSSLTGRVVFLNFWATWCPPCRDEMASMDLLAKDLRGTDFSMIAVSVDDGWDPIRAFFPGGTTMSILLDPSKTHDVPRAWGTEKFPETFLVDRTGRVRWHVVNKRDWTSPEARRCIDSLLR